MKTPASRIGASAFFRFQTFVLLRCHRRAAFVALAAALDAFVHVADLIAAASTCLADFGAGSAIQRVVFAVATHEVDAGSASRDTVEHQFDVRLLDVVTSFGKAMTGQHVGTGGLTFLAILKAFFHGCGCGTHWFLLLK